MKIYFINFIPFPPTLDLESTLGLSAMQFDAADCSVEICVDTLDPVGVLWVRSCSLVLGASNIFPSKLFQMTVNSLSQSNFIFHYILTWLLPQGVSVIWLFEIRKESSTESICSPVGLYQGNVSVASVSTNVSLHLCVPCVLLKDKCSIKFYEVNVSLERRMPHEHHRRQYQV